MHDFIPFFAEIDRLKALSELGKSAARAGENEDDCPLSWDEGRGDWIAGYRREKRDQAEKRAWRDWLGK